MSEYTCNKCGEPYELRPGCEPTELCDPCAQDALLDIRNTGISLRDWFAGQALASTVICPSTEMNAQWCYKMADAMLAERARKEKP